MTKGKKEEAAEESVQESSSDELEKLQEELKEANDKYLRSLAELENARKRMQKEKQDLVQWAQKELLLDLLAPLDHFGNALSFTGQAGEEVQHWAKGFEMILQQFEQVLDAKGIKPFESVGQPFDPHQHEAVEMVETDDAEPGVVLKELIKGYRWNDEVLRPARVQVAKEKSQVETTNLGETYE